MRRASSPALLLATASLAVLGTHAPAFATDTTTELTKADMTAALTRVATDSAAAAEHGWQGTNTFAIGEASGKDHIQVDTEAGIVVDRFSHQTLTGETYASAGKGRYEGLFDSRAKAIVKMTGRTGTGYLFTPGKSLTVTSFLEETFTAPISPFLTPPPGKARTNAHEAGTKTSKPDGTTDYQVFDAEHSMTLTIHVSAAGTLTGVDSIAQDVNSSITYTYGKQRVLTPPASQAISRAELRLASEYLNMAGTAEHAEHVADAGATATRKAARGGTIKVARLRTELRSVAKRYHTRIKMTIVKVGDVKGGARVFVRNPWTKAVRAYRVKACGKRVVVT